MTVITATDAPYRHLGMPAEPARLRPGYRRGTRGFAAVVIGLAGLVVLAVGAVVLPNVELDRIARSWLIPLTLASGVGHLAAAYGLVRARTWAPALTGYLAAIGIGVAAYGLLVTLTGLDPFGATSSLPRDEARARGVGVMVWMIGLWVIAFRFAIRARRQG